MAKEQPFLKFYCESWLGDPHLRCCDASDRGVLIDLMCLGHFGSPYGFVTNGGMPITEKQIMKALGIPWQTWKKCRKSLLESGRLKFDEEQKAFFIPKMVRDGAKLSAATFYGKQGGNPKLKVGGKNTSAQSESMLLMEYGDQIWNEMELLRVKDNTSDHEENIRRLWVKANDVMKKASYKELKDVVSNWQKNGRSL